MKRFYKGYLKPLSKSLRKRMTKEEIILWARIRRKQVNNLQFYRQKPLGPYIIDFYCPKKKIVIEIDGGQHYDQNNYEKDLERDRYLREALKLKVIRFTNLDIKQNLDGVLEVIYQATE
jgi:very-short-patch-repair endonuclease